MLDLYEFEYDTSDPELEEALREEHEAEIDSILAIDS